MDFYIIILVESEVPCHIKFISINTNISDVKKVYVIGYVSLVLLQPWH